MPTTYSFTNTVKYTDDDEYRAALIKQFGCDPSEEDEDGECCLVDAMDTVFGTLSTDPLMKRIIDKFENEYFGFGKYILFSHDYFSKFHECIRTWHLTPEEWKESHATYIALVHHDDI